MQSHTPKPDAPVLPAHLAAACIYARPSHKSAPIFPLPSGVLRELALLSRTR